MATATKNQKADPHLAHAANIADATEEVNDLVDAVDDAREEVATLRGRIQKGDPDVTPADLANAIAAVEFTALRQYGAAVKLYNLRRSKPFRPVVADAVAAALDGAFGFPFVAVEKVPAEKSDGSAPVAYVVQESGATRGWGGPNAETEPVTAPVSITLHKHGVPWVRSLDSGEVIRALKDAGLGTRDIGGGHGLFRGVPVTLHLVRGEVNPSMLKPDLTPGDTPTYPRLIFDIAEPTADGAMYH